MVRQCVYLEEGGQQCRASPLREGEFCFMHAPEHAHDMVEARRLGGLRRRREATVAGAFDFVDLQSVSNIRRILEIAVLDTLGLENSIARSRTLAYLGMTAIKLLDVGEVERRLASLEAAVPGDKVSSKSMFDVEPPNHELSQEPEW